MAFEFTAHMAAVSNTLWAVTSAVGAGFCFLVLLIIAAVWCHPKSRSHLDRVSFRIVTYALFINMIFGIASAVGGWLTGPGFLCGFSIFILQLTLQLSSFLLFSIALNLQLVVVHGVNGQRMEKFYLIGSAIMSLVLVVPPYAAGQYGWDPLEKDCWYTNDNRKQRIIWQVTTQMTWTALTVLGEILCSTAVMAFMLRHTWRQRRVFHSSQSLPPQGAQAAPQVIRAINYKQIILRVAMYPVASCCVNLISVVTALHSTIADGIHNQTDYNVLLLSDFLYGGRAVVYALLAASDPALIRGVKTLMNQLIHGPHTSMGSSKESTTERGTTSSRLGTGTNHGPLVVHIELSTIHSPPLESELEGPIDGDRDGDKASAKEDCDNGGVQKSSVEHDINVVDHHEHHRDRVDLESGIHIPGADSEEHIADSVEETTTRREAGNVGEITRRRTRRERRMDQDTFKRQI